MKKLTLLSLLLLFPFFIYENRKVFDGKIHQKNIAVSQLIEKINPIEEQTKTTKKALSPKKPELSLQIENLTKAEGSKKPFETHAPLLAKTTLESYAQKETSEALEKKPIKKECQGGCVNYSIPLPSLQLYGSSVDMENSQGNYYFNWKPRSIETEYNKWINNFADTKTPFSQRKKTDQSVEINTLIFFDETPRLLTNMLEVNQKGIIIENVFVPNVEEFKVKMSKFLEKKITPQLLKEIKNTVALYYKKHGYYFATTIIPPKQDITSGTLRVLILTGKISKIKIENNRYFSEKYILNQIVLKEGEIINQNELIKDISWLNENPFMKASTIFEEGEKLGTADLIVKIKDKFPVRVYGGYQNTGNIIAGDSRWLTGLNAGNLFGIEHQLNYQFMTALNVKDWQGHSLNYIIPLPWRHIFKLYGSYVDTKIPQGDYHLNGRAKSIGTKYNIPLYCSSAKHYFVTGYDFKRTNNFVDYAKIFFFKKDIDISQFSFSYELYYKFISFNATTYISPGYIGKYNKNKYFEQEREGASCHYIYGTISFDSNRKLAKDFSWIFSSLLQLSSTKLMPSEQLSLGGNTSIRGYRENDVIADFGVLMKNEIRTPPFALFLSKTQKDELQLLAFCDFGWGAAVDKAILWGDAKTLTSIGAGLRYHLLDNFTLRLDCGWPLVDIHRKDQIKDRYNFHFESILSF